MSRVVVIGATGHVGTYLVPRLVRGGHRPGAPTRGRQPLAGREPGDQSPPRGRSIVPARYGQRSPREVAKRPLV